MTTWNELSKAADGYVESLQELRKAVDKFGEGSYEAHQIDKYLAEREAEREADISDIELDEMLNEMYEDKIDRDIDDKRL